MSANIFISYAGQDLKVASTLCKALESRGFHCWISSRDILPGENFQVAIVRAIRNAKMMLLVFTANSNNSEEMTKELALASQNKLIVVPLRIEDVAPSDAFSYEFATRQWIDFFSDWETAMNQLSERIASALPEDAPPAAVVKPETAPEAPAAKADAPAPVSAPAPAPAPAPAVASAVSAAVVAAPVVEKPKEAVVAEARREPEPATALKAPETKLAPAAAPPLAARAAETKPAEKPADAKSAKPADVVGKAPPPTAGRPDLKAAAAAMGAPPEKAKSRVGVFVAIAAVVVLVIGAGLVAPSFLNKKAAAKPPVVAAAAPAAVPPGALPTVTPGPGAASPAGIVPQTPGAPSIAAANTAAPEATNAAASNAAVASATPRPARKRVPHAAAASASHESEVPF
ncbi:MAG: toll/interleukin-1 receptor domain-containing protein [Caulobacterales bacterium]